MSRVFVPITENESRFSQFFTRIQNFHSLIAPEIVSCGFMACLVAIKSSISRLCVDFLNRNLEIQQMINGLQHLEILSFSSLSCLASSITNFLIHRLKFLAKNLREGGKFRFWKLMAQLRTLFFANWKFHLFNQQFSN